MSSYSDVEEKKIVDYIVANKLIDKIKGDKIWKDMQGSLEGRTWQSLKQHFRKKIIYELHYPRYGLDMETQALFRASFFKIVRKKKEKTTDEVEKRYPHFSSDDDSSADERQNVEIK